MKFLYTTDIHGDKRKYKEVYRQAVEQNAELVVNGGDMLPKTGDLFRSQREFLQWFNKDHLKKYQESNIKYFGMLGNDDLKYFDSYFNAIESVCSVFKNLAWCSRNTDYCNHGIEWIGCNWVKDYPFQLKDRCCLDKIDSTLGLQLGRPLFSSKYFPIEEFTSVENWYEYVSKEPSLNATLWALPTPSLPRQIYVIHEPPAGCGLDVISTGEPVGSESVRDFLLNKQPMLSLHGHIHESPNMSGHWFRELDQTLAVQPGQGIFDELVFVIVNLIKDNTISLERVVFSFSKNQVINSDLVLKKDGQLYYTRDL